MALVDLKSDLSRKNFKETISPTQNLEDTATPIPSQGVNYFNDINATGFTINRGNSGLNTDFILNDSGGPIIPQTAYTDIKGDTASIFSPTNKSYPNVYNTGTNQTPLQNLSSDLGNTIDGKTNFATTPNRYGFTFTPPFNEQNKLPTIFNTEPEKSRIYFKHLSDKSGIDNAGFTRNGLGLDNYYAQQPTNFRSIGQRWGDGGIDIPLVPGFVEAILNPIANLASPVFGRDISIFTNQYKASVNRIGQFANPVSTYALKQTFLHRQNKYDKVYSQVMGLGGNQGALTGDGRFSEILEAAAASGILDINPQVYNQASIFSVPGVSGMMFNRNGRNFGDIATLANTAVDEVVGLAKSISVRALQAAAPAAVKFINTGLGGLVGAAGTGLSALGSALGKIEVGKIRGRNQKTQPLSSIFKKVANSKVGIAIQGAAMDAGSLVRRGIQETGELVKAAEKFGNSVKENAKVFTDDVGKVSKHQASKLDPRAFEDVKVDRVNLIPYGKLDYKGDSHEALDLIPFKFVDARDNKPIVFRAILSGITDTFSPEYASERYVGRPDNVYVYQGTSREISFNFDVYPKSDTELVTLWEKLNYLAGLTYPHYGVGQTMVAPFSKLTIGQMYTDTPGYISSLTYTVQDNTTWEVDFAKLPKYIQVACTFTYIGDRLPSATQAHYDVPWVGKENYGMGENFTGGILEIASVLTARPPEATLNAATDSAKKFLKMVGK